jgi:thiol-disulfide isomerase/thioredoxin
MKVLKFGAVWCPGCLVMKPRWEEIEKEHPWLETEYFDYDKSKDAVKQYCIGTNLPVFVFLDKDRNEILRLQGEIKKDELIRIITENKDG